MKLFVPDEAPKVSFEEVSLTGLCPATPWEEVARITQPLTVKIAQECVDQNEPLFRVAAVTCAQNSTAQSAKTVFAVVVSMSHILGDGATFYEISSMLGNRAASSSPPERELPNFEATAVADAPAVRKLPAFPRSTFDRRYTRPAYEAWCSARIITGCVAWTVADMLWPGQRFRKYAEWRFVDEEWVAHCKTEAKSQAQSTQARGVSTNDVVMSWLLCKGRYDLGLMAVNLRGGRQGGSSGDEEDFIAGNLESALTVLLPACAPGKLSSCAGGAHFAESANVVRRFLEEYRRVGGAVDPAQHPRPRPWLEALRSNHIFVSNWAGVTRRIDLRAPPPPSPPPPPPPSTLRAAATAPVCDCEQVLHLPLLDPTAGQRATAIVFEATVDSDSGDGATAVLIADRNPRARRRFFANPAPATGRSLLLCK
jgi:hypothetical protein